jgi:hypothetical protein
MLIIVPTVSGREESLKQTLEGYSRTIPDDTFVRVEYGHPTCGEAWNQGVTTWSQDLNVTMIHLTADDIVPEPGWYEAAVETLRRGVMPAPKVYSPSNPGQASFGHMGDGQLMHIDETPDRTPCRTSVIPTLWREWWRPCLPIHYYSDDWMSLVVRHQAVPIETVKEYAFTHGFADGGARPDMYERIRRDRATFMSAAEAL